MIYNDLDYLTTIMRKIPARMRSEEHNQLILLIDAIVSNQHDSLFELFRSVLLLVKKLRALANTKLKTDPYKSLETFHENIIAAQNILSIPIDNLKPGKVELPTTGFQSGALSSMKSAATTKTVPKRPVQAKKPVEENPEEENPEEETPEKADEEEQASNQSRVKSRQASNRASPPPPSSSSSSSSGSSARQRAATMYDE